MKNNKKYSLGIENIPENIQVLDIFEEEILENNQKKSGPGRPKGAKNRKKADIESKARERLDKALSVDYTPLEFLLSVFKDKDQFLEVRIDAAKAAAPYVHPRLAQIEAKVTGEIQYTISSEPLTIEQWASQYGTQEIEDAPVKQLEDHSDE